MATLVLAAAIALSVFCYTGTSAVFVAYGVAMAGIGMLTLTGNTISMDVFGPVADNANGIGEMGYEKEEMGEEGYKRARQILADLDAVGNTTKAETKGIAIGSAVIAAVSMFASFIATLAMGSEEKIMEMSQAQYEKYSALLTVADPKVLIGLLIGGTVPWLFSSMLIPPWDAPRSSSSKSAASSSATKRSGRARRSPITAAWWICAPVPLRAS